MLGRILHPSKDSGNKISQWILKSNGRAVPTRTLWPFRTEELHSPVEVKKREMFGVLSRRKLQNTWIYK